MQYKPHKTQEIRHQQELKKQLKRQKKKFKRSEFVQAFEKNAYESCDSFIKKVYYCIV